MKSEQVGMHIKALGQLREAAFASQGSKGHFSLKSRGMIPSFTSHSLISLVGRILKEIHLTHRPESRVHF